MEEKKPIKTIQEKVAESIQGSKESIVSTIVDKLAEIEIEKRIKIITDAVNKQTAMINEFKKSHRPDIAEGLGINREVISPATYSKSKLDVIQKDKEKLANLTKALENCLETNTPESYVKLTESLNKCANSGKDTKPDIAESSTES